MPEVTQQIIAELTKLGVTEAPLVLQMLRHANTLEGETARRAALVTALKSLEDAALGKLYPSD